MTKVAQIRFYHLQRQGVDGALPKLLERMLDQGMRAVVRVPDEKSLENLDTSLWTYDPASFLPHGTARTGHADSQPIYLTTKNENPNGATAFVALGGSIADAVGQYDALFYMFDGRDDDAVAKARAEWKALKERDAELTYWQQKESGGWEKKG